MIFLIVLCSWIGSLPIALFIVGRYFTEPEERTDDKQMKFGATLFWPVVLVLATIVLPFWIVGKIGSAAWRWFKGLARHPQEEPDPHVGDYRSTKGKKR